MYWRSNKKIPKRIGVNTQPYLTPLLTENASDVAPLKLTVQWVSSWKKVMMFEQKSWGTSNVVEFLKLPFAYKVNRKVYKGKAERHLLLPTILLYLM